MLITKNEIYQILQSVHHTNYTVNDLKNFFKNNTSLDISRFIYKKTGDSILHIAAKLGRTDFLEFLLNHWGPEVVDFKNNDCKTPLHEACQFSQSGTVEFLIENGANINAIKRADWTPLMLACTKTGGNSLKIIKILLKRGAVPNLKNKDGWTALHLASREGDLKIVKELVQNGADFKLKTKNGRTILHIATLHNNFEIAKYFFSLFEDEIDHTVLHEAIFSNNIELVDYLVQNKFDINAVNKVGFGCLHLAASENYTNIIKLLILNYKMDINLKSLAGYTPLHCAARKKQKEAMNVLFELGANADIKDELGRTANDYYLM